jgi:hypothetical protein
MRIQKDYLSRRDARAQGLRPGRRRPHLRGRCFVVGGSDGSPVVGAVRSTSRVEHLVGDRRPLQCSTVRIRRRSSRFLQPLLPVLQPLLPGRFVDESRRAREWVLGSQLKSFASVSNLIGAIGSVAKRSPRCSVFIDSLEGYNGRPSDASRTVSFGFDDRSGRPRRHRSRQAGRRGRRRGTRAARSYRARLRPASIF